jgi:hypothetical protein
MAARSLSLTCSALRACVWVGGQVWLLLCPSLDSNSTFPSVFHSQMGLIQSWVPEKKIESLLGPSGKGTLPSLAGVSWWAGQGLRLSPIASLRVTELTMPVFAKTCLAGETAPSQVTASQLETLKKVSVVEGVCADCPKEMLLSEDTARAPGLPLRSPV